jgi:hypothetical protein
MGVGVFCPKCKNTFAFFCNNCLSYETEVFESAELINYFQTRAIYYFKCRRCDSEYDYTVCPVCGKNILPVEPFVNGDKGKGSVKLCFVATACLDEKSPILPQLYLFRDEILKKHHLGRQFIKYYYVYGPKLAFLIKKNKLIRTFSRYLIVYPVYYASCLVLKIINFHESERYL